MQGLRVSFSTQEKCGYLPYPHIAVLKKYSTLRMVINESVYFPLLKKGNSAIMIFNYQEKVTFGYYLLE